MRDHYRVLSVTPRADMDAIRNAYRGLMRELHPDVSGQPVDSVRFTAITDAYRVLSDPRERRRYDTMRFFTLAGPLGRVFDTLGNPQKRFTLAMNFSKTARKIFKPSVASQDLDGADIVLRRDISFVEAYCGGQLPVSYQRLIRCKPCEGSGLKQFSVCPLCGGRGEFILQGGLMRKICPKCGGAGAIGRGRCATCHGKQRLPEEVMTTLLVPPGISQIAKLRVKGKGHEGRFRGVDGDLIVDVGVAGSLHYSRQGHDLIVERDIPLHTAMSGGVVAIALPDNSAVEVTIPPLSHPGSEIRVPERGFPDISHGRLGDLVVRIDIFIPENLDEQARLLAMEWLFAAAGNETAKANQLAKELLKLMDGTACDGNSSSS